MGAMRAIGETGRLPGQDIGVIGSDDNPFGRYMVVPLTTFTSPRIDAGRRIAELLLGAINRQPATELQEIWRPELVLRGSEGP